jgi:hypothetical protein
MNLLLLIYAMLAGLTGFNAGPSTVARTAPVAEAGSVAPAASAAGQASIAAKALSARAAWPVRVPAAPIVDARRIAATLVAAPIVVIGRAAPERRLE